MTFSAYDLGKTSWVRNAIIKERQGYGKTDSYDEKNYRWA